MISALSHSSLQSSHFLSAAPRRGSAVNTGGGISHTIKTKAIFSMAYFLNYSTTKGGIVCAER